LTAYTCAKPPSTNNEQSRHSIDVIAQQTGFADRYRMRRAFLRAFGQPPQVIRRNARA
jgi:transcriptional regulator GlxA family with amidase domain